MSIILDSPRTFQLWRATVGHGQVLFRSPKTESVVTRVDILFKPVQAMKTRTTLEGLRIRAATPAETMAVLSDAGEAPNAPFKAFVLESQGFSGYVVAGAAVVAEDEGEYNEQSSLYAGQNGP